MQLRARMQKLLVFWSRKPPGDSFETLLMKTRLKEEDIFPAQKLYSKYLGPKLN